MSSGISTSDGNFRLINIIFENIYHDFNREINVMSIKRESNISCSSVFICFIESKQCFLKFSHKLLSCLLPYSFSSFFQIFSHATSFFWVIVQSSFKNFIKVLNINDLFIFLLLFWNDNLKRVFDSKSECIFMFQVCFCFNCTSID